MFEPFQKFLNRAANNYGVSKEVEAAKICYDFEALIPDLFNLPQAREYIRPGYYKNQILVVRVQNPAWAQEVIMRAPKIIAEMNRKAGKQIIKYLRTQLGSQSSIPPGS